MARKNYKKKSLSKSNIFGKKSAKNQAKQIYALNKKVNYIQKTTSPETKTYSQVLTYFDTYDAAHSTLLTEYHRRYNLYADRILNTGMSKYLKIDGDLLRVKNIYLYGYFGLKDYGEKVVEGAVLPPPKDAYLKITVCRVIKSGTNYPDRLYPPLENLGNSVAYSEGIPISQINGPMIDGTTAQLQVLKKKVIKVSPAKTSRMFKIKLFNSKKCNLNYRIAQFGAFNQGEIMIYMDYISPVTLYNTTDPQVPVAISPRCVCQINYKLVYSDDGTEVITNS